ALARRGEFDRAERVAGFASPAYHRDGLVSELAVAAVRADDPDRAERLLDTIERSFERAEVLGALAGAAVRGGERDRAAELAGRAEELARAQAYPVDRHRALTGLATELARAGEPGWAEGMVSSIDEPSDATRALAQ